MLSKRRAPLTRKEKSFFLLTTLLCAGVVIFAYMSAVPLVKIDEPAPLPSPNAFSFYKTAEVAMRTAKAPVDPGLDADYFQRTDAEKAWLYSLPRRKSWLKANASIGMSIRKGMALPYRPPLKNWDDYYAETNFVYPRFAFAYIEVETRTYLVEKQTNNALNCALDLLQIAGQITGGGITRGRIAEKQLIEMSGELIQESLESTSIEDLQKAIQRTNSLMDKRESYSQVLGDWRNRDLSQILKKMSRPPFHNNLDGGWRYSYWNGADSALEQAAFQTFSKHSFISAVENVFKVAKQESRKPFKGNSGIPATWYIRPLKWNLDGSRVQDAENLTQRRFLLLLLALRLFEKQHGKFPEKLSELSPHILESLPADPFSLTKSTFYFKKTGNDFLLYSVGRNNVNNGGKYKSTWGNWKEDSETSDLDDIIFKRKIFFQYKVPKGTKPKRPNGKAPLFVPPLNSTLGAPIP